MNKSPECTIVIPVFNKWELTRKCMESLHRHCAGHDLELIVVDNGSTDATAAELATLGTTLFDGGFSAIRFPENRNFGPACNAGAAAATSDLLFFLNNDTILTPGWLPPLLETMRGDDAPGAAGPLLLYEDDTVQHLGVALGADGVLHLYRDFPATHPAVGRKRALQFITAAAMLMPRDLFFDCGGFFEGYRNGFEDIELCVRIRERGKHLACVPESRIYHLESRTPGRKDNDARNGELLEERCGGAMAMDLHRHALRDGFAVKVNDLFALSVLLTDRAENDLLQEVHDKPAKDWLRLVRENPLWVRGREVLAQGLERAGRGEDAVLFRIALAEIDPAETRFNDLLRLKQFASGATWPEEVEKRLAKLRGYKSDPSLAKARVRDIRRKFAPGGDAFLENAYREKLHELVKRRLPRAGLA